MVTVAAATLCCRYSSTNECVNVSVPMNSFAAPRAWLPLRHSVQHDGATPTEKLVDLSASASDKGHMQQRQMNAPPICPVAFHLGMTQHHRETSPHYTNTCSIFVVVALLVVLGTTLMI